jgi:hypothetical protein
MMSLENTPKDRELMLYLPNHLDSKAPYRKQQAFRRYPVLHDRFNAVVVNSAQVNRQQGVRLKGRLKPKETGKDRQCNEESTQYEQICILDDNVEKVVISNCVTDLPCVLFTGQ